MASSEIVVSFKRVTDSFNDIPLPAYATKGSAGLDIRAAVDEAVEIAVGKFKRIPTNFAVEIPPGFEIQVRPRSGLAFENGITVLNAPGTIDSDYRGEIKVILINLGEKPFTVHRGDRIAQLVLSSVLRMEINETEKIGISDRGAGGFGSSGKK